MRDLSSPSEHTDSAEQLPSGVKSDYFPGAETSRTAKNVPPFNYYSVDLSRYADGVPDPAMAAYLEKLLDPASKPESNYADSSQSYAIFILTEYGELIWSKEARTHGELNAAREGHMAAAQMQGIKRPGEQINFNGDYYLHLNLFTGRNTRADGKRLASFMATHLRGNAPYYLNFRASNSGIESGSYPHVLYMGWLFQYPEFADMVPDKTPESSHISLRELLLRATREAERGNGQ